jgi:hypothetical protein
MPHIRTVKPELFFDEELEALGDTAKIAFIGLFCQADRRGRMKDQPEILRCHIFPHRPELDFDSILWKLHPRFIVRYKNEDGRVYIWVRNFEKHQRPHHTEAESAFPSHKDKGSTILSTVSPLANGELTVISRLANGGKGREGKGKEGKGKEDGELASPKPDKPKKPTDPHWGKLVAHVRASYEKNGYEFGRRDGSILKAMLARHTVPELMALWDLFLSGRKSYATEPGQIVNVVFNAFVFRASHNYLVEQNGWKEKATEYQTQLEGTPVGITVNMKGIPPKENIQARKLELARQARDMGVIS